MANELRYLSGFNGYLPRETGMVVGYIRKESEFALNKYVQYVETPSTVGVYARLGRDQSVRVPAEKARRWEDGDERPRHDQEKHSWRDVEFRTMRNDYGWTLGYKAIALASWRPKVVHMDDAISQCMTDRTRRVITLLETAGTWEGNTASANTLNGGAGNWRDASDDPTSPKYNAIFKSIMTAAQRIHLATNAKVKFRDLRCLISPGAAIAISESPEIQNYQRETPQAEKIQSDGHSDDPDFWTLPKRYKGIEFVVEDSPMVTEYPDASASLTEATTNRLYVKSDTSAVLITRKGTLDGEYGSKSLSTIQIFHYGGLLEVEAFDEPKHRRVDGHVTEDVKEVVPAPQSGYLITGIL